MNENILILSDSLAGPLFKKNQNLVIYTDSWPYLFKKANCNCEVAQSSIVSATMVDMVKQAEYWKSFFPHTTIIQVGLNDCQPRILKLHEKIFLSQYSWGKYFSQWLAKRGRIIRRLRKLTYTKQDDFRQAVREIQGHSNKTIWLAIVCHPDIEVGRLPGLRENIRRYNEILKEETGENFLDLSDLQAHHFTIDHLHLSPEGHREVYNRIQVML